MKTSKIVKNIVSTVLVMCIVLSFTLVEVFANSVPVGANVELSATKDFENGSIGTNVFSGYTTSLYSGGGDKAIGNYSCAVSDNTDKGTGYFVITFMNSGFVSDKTDAASNALKAGTYYFSYYAYSPDATVVNKARPFGTASYIIDQTIPQGQWTKITGMMTYDENASDYKANSRLLDFYIEGLNGNTVYFDEFVVARVSSIDDIALTESSFSYDFETNTAVATYTSPVELAGLDVEKITISDGATVSNVALSNGGCTVTLGLSNLDLNHTYDVEFKDIVDAFNRKVTLNLQVITPAEYDMSVTDEIVVENTATYLASIKKKSPGSANVALIVATYDENGEMVEMGMDINLVETSSGEVPFSVEVAKGVTYTAIFVDWTELVIIE